MHIGCFHLSEIHEDKGIMHCTCSDGITIDIPKKVFDKYVLDVSSQDPQTYVVTEKPLTMNRVHTLYSGLVYRDEIVSFSQPHDDNDQCEHDKICTFVRDNKITAFISTIKKWATLGLMRE